MSPREVTQVLEAAQMGTLKPDATVLKVFEAQKPTADF
jgi:hypothetical protein